MHIELRAVLASGENVMQRQHDLLGVLSLLIGLSGLITGCSSEYAATSKDDPSVKSSESAAVTGPMSSTQVGGTAAQNAVDEEHPHKPGSHGGIIIPIGSDSYHAEAVIEKSGDFRLLMLGKDETRILEVDIQPVQAYVNVVGEPDAIPVDMPAVPQDGDAADKTSQFVGQLPVSIPRLISRPTGV
jgi:hypothetical protein